MVQQEQELKILISAGDFRLLKKFLSFLTVRTALQTERKVFKVCEGIVLMLDLNQYLGTVDYELEIEYSETLRKQAEGILMLIGSMVGNYVSNEVISKSERFFRGLNS